MSAKLNVKFNPIHVLTIKLTCPVNGNTWSVVKFFAIKPLINDCLYYIWFEFISKVFINKPSGGLVVYVVGGENRFLSLKDILVPAPISLLTKLVNATVLVDRWPKQVITVLTLGVIP